MKDELLMAKIKKPNRMSSRAEIGWICGGSVLGEYAGRKNVILNIIF